MAYSHTLDLVQGDTNPQLIMTIRDANRAAAGLALDAENPATWEVVNLTGCVVRLKLRMVGIAILKDTLVGTVTDGPGGKVAFFFNDTTLDEAGQLEGEVEITDADERVQTIVDMIKLRIREQL